MLIIEASPKEEFIKSIKEGNKYGQNLANRLVQLYNARKWLDCKFVMLYGLNNYRVSQEKVLKWDTKKTESQNFKGVYLIVLIKRCIYHLKPQN